MGDRHRLTLMFRRENGEHVHTHHPKPATTSLASLDDFPNINDSNKYLPVHWYKIKLAATECFIQLPSWTGFRGERGSTQWLLPDPACLLLWYPHVVPGHCQEPLPSKDHLAKKKFIGRICYIGIPLLFLITLISGLNFLRKNDGQWL